LHDLGVLDVAKIAEGGEPDNDCVECIGPLLAAHIALDEGYVKATRGSIPLLERDESRLAGTTV
jgi:hypothetical protein